ncbi:MAG: S8 family serine peptidase [Candidatus Eisenbacteria bacterium]|uniref:S8 family serine peptidase n=1 Tax=Eiseniibacteriota bacterium TaxID=2212470 RepID=A0A7Y2E8G4_UNCEI|nr:S8 family serine peptidase [Candidatus Eisenbacteria bacterium]
MGFTSFDNGKERVHANSHDGVTIVAPGWNWPLLNRASGYIPEPTDPSPRTGKFGSSYAAPIVSGVASLIWSLRPDFSSRRVIEILVTSTDRPSHLGPGPDPSWGMGRVNAYAALRAAIRSA